MPKVFDIDAAIQDNKTYVKLRGDVYELRDLTVRERIEKITEFMRKQDEVEARVREEGEEPDFEHVQGVIAEAIQEAFIGVPEEVAKSVTEREWQLIQETIQKAQQQKYPIDAEDMEEDELKNLKGKAD